VWPVFSSSQAAQAIARLFCEGSKTYGHFEAAKAEHGVWYPRRMTMICSGFYKHSWLPGRFDAPVSNETTVDSAWSVPHA
jgi:hypothetical protein